MPAIGSVNILPGYFSSANDYRVLFSPSQDGFARGRRSGRFIGRRRFGRGVQLIEPPLQRVVAAVARRGRRCLDAIGLTGRAAKPDMHVRGMAIPRPDQLQPRPVAGHLAAQLLFDRGIDQDAVDVRQTGGDAQQRGDARRPDRRIDVAPVGPHQAAQFDRVALRADNGGRGPHVQPDIGVQADLVADMAARHRAAAGAGDVFDQQRRQAGGGGLAAELSQMGDGLRRAPERAAVQMDGLEPGPSAAG